MILLIDNYDSFVYNLAHMIESRGLEAKVVRNDEIDVIGIAAANPEGIVLSPGPCTPDEAGICLETVRTFSGKIPILGVCLGHQVIGQAFGGRVKQTGKPVHGKTSKIFHDGEGVFDGVENPFEAARYHSLVVEGDNLPSCLHVSAHTKDGCVMGIRHTKYPIEGIQFHPESILTEPGQLIIDNFLGGRK